jgi:hypothetical protein
MADLIEFFCPNEKFPGSGIRGNLKIMTSCPQTGISEKFTKAAMEKKRTRKNRKTVISFLLTPKAIHPPHLSFGRGAVCFSIIQGETIETENKAQRTQAARVFANDCKNPREYKAPSIRNRSKCRPVSFSWTWFPD